MWPATSVSVKPLPWFHHSCIAWITSCLLCSMACKVLLWRPHESHPPCALPRSSGQGQTSPVWDQEGPLLFLPLAEGALGVLRAALPSWAQGEPSAAALLPLIRGKGSSPWIQGASAPGLDPIPVWGTATGPPALGAQHWHTGLGTHCNRQGKNFNCSEMGLYGVYCSKHFIILQWDVLWSAKYYCKVKLRFFFFFFKIPRNFSAFP